MPDASILPASYRPTSRCHHGQRACSISARAWVQFRLKPRPVGVQFGVTVGQGLQFIEHGGDVPRHADLIGLGVVGSKPFHQRLQQPRQIWRHAVVSRRLTPREGEPEAGTEIRAVPETGRYTASISGP
jgi:hypothetical protein